MKKKPASGRYGRLVVTKEVGQDVKSGNYLYLCLCDCGNKVTVTGSSLRTGNTESCGCIRSEYLENGTNKKHGLCGTLTYASWVCMIARCYNENNGEYFRYGAVGIRVYKPWHNPLKFLKDMGERPSEDHCIDRIDATKGYYPRNCRWLTKSENTSRIIWTEERRKKHSLRMKGNRFRRGKLKTRLP